MKTQRPKLVNGLAQVHTPEPKILVAKGSERVLLSFKDSLAGCWLIKTFMRKVLRSLFFSFYANRMEICLFVQCKRVKMWKRLNCMESNFAAKEKYTEKNDKRNKWRGDRDRDLLFYLIFSWNLSPWDTTLGRSNAQGWKHASYHVELQPRFGELLGRRALIEKVVFLNENHSCLLSASTGMT